MSINFDESDSGLSRILYLTHGYMSEPIYRVVEYVTRCKNPLTPDMLDHYSTKGKEWAYRIIPSLILAGLFTTALIQFPFRQVAVLSGKTLAGLLVYEVLRTAIHMAARFNQKKFYIHVKGVAKEIITDTPVIATWNIFGFPAGGNYTYGGCTPFRKRFPEIVETIRKENADVVILQECIWDSKIPEDIIRAFKDQYAHFFIHNGPEYLYIESGLFIMSKSPIESYTYTSFAQQGGGMNRGFVTLKIKGQTKSYAIIGTHMEADAPENRKSQLAQIHAAATKIAGVDQVILAGDTNINMQTNEAETFKQQFYNPFQEMMTCTNLFRQQRDLTKKGPPAESVDVIAPLGKGRYDMNPKVVQGYQESSKTAKSDHHMLVATIQPKPSSRL